jgi:hypothetical protein
MEQSNSKGIHLFAMTQAKEDKFGHTKVVKKP